MKSFYQMVQDADESNVMFFLAHDIYLNMFPSVSKARFVRYFKQGMGLFAYQRDHVKGKSEHNRSTKVLLFTTGKYINVNLLKEGHWDWPIKVRLFEYDLINCCVCDPRELKRVFGRKSMRLCRANSLRYGIAHPECGRYVVPDVCLKEFGEERVLSAALYWIVDECRVSEVGRVNDDVCEEYWQKCREYFELPWIKVEKEGRYYESRRRNSELEEGFKEIYREV